MSTIGVVSVSIGVVGDVGWVVAVKVIWVLATGLELPQQRSGRARGLSVLRRRRIQIRDWRRMV